VQQNNKLQAEVKMRLKLHAGKQCSSDIENMETQQISRGKCVVSLDFLKEKTPARHAKYSPCGLWAGTG